METNKRYTYRKTKMLSRLTDSKGKGQWRCFRRLIFLILILTTGLLLYSTSFVINLRRMNLQGVKTSISLVTLRHSVISKKLPQSQVDHGIQSAYRSRSVGSPRNNTSAQNSGKSVSDTVKLQRNALNGKGTFISVAKSNGSAVPLNQSSFTNVKESQNKKVHTIKMNVAPTNVFETSVLNRSLGSSAHDIRNSKNTIGLKTNVSSNHNKATKEFRTTKTLSANRVPRYYLTVQFDGRLGNRMFEYASLLGIAMQNNLKPIIDRNEKLAKIFKVNTDSSNTYWSLKFTKKYVERKGCTYEPEVREIGDSENAKLIGFFQSWKYFTDPDVQFSIRQQFQFKDDIMTRAKQEFDRITLSKSRIFTGKVTYVAVHVRRGDMTYNKEYVKYGYTSPEVGYLKKGMEKFRSLHKNCLFVVASDDLKWCRTNIQDPDVVFVSPGNSAEMDMAILTLCDHTLMTVGSFGWWIAWLNNGTTIYYSGYPTSGSKLAALFNSNDYRPPKWIAMT